ncbi:MAG TPA: insulinase family protein [Clostridia bacterium]|nr:insulinase family protein [Clostridia bacterium]
MQLKIGDIYHGFRLLTEKEVKETNSAVRLFRHEKSGARLFYMENEDDNKVFSITFRTPPHNSAGTPHILEHSVLCGSRKFPTKEPFVELVKGSLNTFLNAFTFGDKTMYPVASRNDKDFENLMDVYLDSVFHPNIYKYPEILKQEGWHYEIDSVEEELKYKGVVYNEMKGALSSPDSVLSRKLQETLFPDTPYGYESGGDPEEIPELTQEDFLEFHRKYYHPSNSYMFLYGNVNLLDRLRFIDEEYLREYAAISAESAIPLQPAFQSMKTVEIEYPISLQEDERDKTYLSLNYAAGLSTEPEHYLAMEILEHILLSTPASPLKKALVEAGLGKDVFGKYDNSILQPVFSVIVKNSDAVRQEEFRNIVVETLKRLVNEGLDSQLVEAAVNLKEFQLREADYEGYPKGLIYNIKIMDSWLYDEDPTMHLEYGHIFERIRAGLKNRYFEKLIQKYILDNNHCSLLVLKPRKGMAEAKEEETRSKLKSIKAGMSSEQLRELVKQTQRLKDWQNTPDTPDKLALIPMLSIKDIEREGEVLPQLVKEELGIKVLAHHMFTNGIIYADLMFDTTAVPQELLTYIPLLSGILGKVSTEHYGYGELSKEIDMHTGGIRFSTPVYGEKNNDSIYHPVLSIKGRALAVKLPRLLELIGEIITGTDFDDVKRIREIIRENKSRIEMRIANEGYTIACKRLFSYFSEEGTYLETISGLTYYRFIAEMEKNFDSRIEEVQANLRKLMGLIFRKDALIAGVTCEEDAYKAFADNLGLLLGRLGRGKEGPVKYAFESKTLNEGLMTQGKVQYVAQGYNFLKLGYSYTGKLQVLRTISRYSYLWNRIRVQGGAYGAFSGFEKNGNMFMVSYRDPNLAETLRVYDEMHEFLRAFSIDKREMTKYIIGTVSRLDSPLTPFMKGERAIENYMRKITREDLRKEREEILGTSQQDIRELSDMMLELMKRKSYCVLGSESKLKENRELFGSLIEVFS